MLSDAISESYLMGVKHGVELAIEESLYLAGISRDSSKSLFTDFAKAKDPGARTLANLLSNLASGKALDRVAMLTTEQVDHLFEVAETSYEVSTEVQQTEEPED